MSFEGIGLISRGLAQQTKPKRKCFISYFSGDTNEVDKFLADYGTAFIPKAVGVTDGDDFINSNDSEYVMAKIREKYLGDSTVTLCLIGSCTHSRRYIDWELKATLRRGGYTPNGLVGILLPSMGNSAHLPERFKLNWNRNESTGYALYRSYPANPDQLANWIEDAYSRRATHADFINNTQNMFKYSRKCSVHEATH